ncbi:MAG: CoA transferase [bacterium]|nr:CoA transferase [bacterium]
MNPDESEVEATSPPLAGVRVLDFTRFLAGPFATMMLADYGAEVVKVENRKGREFRPPGAGRDNYFFLSSNRGKRSLTLDFRDPRGRAAIERMLPRFDVVVENFRPGIMQKFGLGPEELTERDPRLVYCSISGFGADGPYRDRPGFDQIAQGMSGLMSVTGTEDSGPTRSGIAIGDLLGGIFAAHGICMALLTRERTGRGQIVDTSLLDALVGVLSWSAGMFFESGRAPGPAGQHHPLSSPYGRFRAADGFMNIAAGTDAMWQKLAHALDRDSWIGDQRFAGAGGRIANRLELSAEIEAALAEHSVEHWVDALNVAGVPAGPVLNLEQVFADPQVLARKLLHELPHPELGTFKTTGLPIKLSQTPGAIETPPPLLGEHTDQVLSECGFSSAEIEELRAAELV